MGLETAAFAAVAAGSVIGANAENQAGKQSYKLSKYNAQVLEFEAQSAEQRGAEDVAAFRRQRAQIIGSQRAGLASGNVDVNSGSAQQVQEETAKWSAFDEAKIKNNAALEAWGYRQQANVQLYEGKAAKQAGKGNALGTLLGGVGTLYGMKY